MAASNYMTEADMKDIWDYPDVDDDKFAKTGIRMAEILNFEVFGNSTNQATDTAYLPIMEQMSEEMFVNLNMANKGVGLHDPWEFLQGNSISLGVNQVIKNWEKQLIKIKDIAGTKRYIGYSSLLTPPSHADYD